MRHARIRFAILNNPWIKVISLKLAHELSSYAFKARVGIGADVLIVMRCLRAMSDTGGNDDDISGLNPDLDTLGLRG